MMLENLLQYDYRSEALYDRPDYYDLDYQGYLAEADFYHALIQRGLAENDVYVELGAGSGRLLERPLRQGVRCHAVDPSQPMLERLLEKAKKIPQAFSRLTIENAKANNFTGPMSSSIGLVTFPFNGLLHVYEYQDMLRSFQHIYGKLGAEGRFALDIMAPAWEVMRARELGWGRLDERRAPDTGETIYTYDCCYFDQSTHLMHSKLRFIKEKATEGVELFYTQRMWTFQEVLGALHAANFEVEEIYGDVDFSTFEEESPRLLVLLRPKYD